jgi:hypothetical protein
MSRHPQLNEYLKKVTHSIKQWLLLADDINSPKTIAQQKFVLCISRMDNSTKQLIAVERYVFELKIHHQNNNNASQQRNNTAITSNLPIALQSMSDDELNELQSHFHSILLKTRTLSSILHSIESNPQLSHPSFNILLYTNTSQQSAQQRSAALISRLTSSRQQQSNHSNTAMNANDAAVLAKQKSQLPQYDETWSAVAIPGDEFRDENMRSQYDAACNALDAQRISSNEICVHPLKSLRMQKLDLEIYVEENPNKNITKSQQLN